MKRFCTVLVIMAAMFSGMTAAPAAHASTLTLGDRVLNVAETKAGDWYVYGAAGPTTFDCSGLVFFSAGRVGLSLPRTTYTMVHSWHLYRVYSPRRGDLAFWGPVGAPYHVEIVTALYHTTFGAAHSGTRVGFHRYYPGFTPSAFYRLR